MARAGWVLAVIGVCVAGCSAPSTGSSAQSDAARSAEFGGAAASAEQAPVPTRIDSPEPPQSAMPPADIDAPIREGSVDLRLLGWLSPGPLGNARMIDLGSGAVRQMKLPPWPRAAVLPNGDVVVVTAGAGVVRLQESGESSTILPPSASTDAHVLADHSGRVVWIASRDGPTLRELYRHRFDSAATELVHTDISSLIGAPGFTLVALKDGLLASSEGRTALIRTDGTLHDLGIGRAVLGSGSRWIRALCDQPTLNECRFELADISQPALAIPVATDYRFLTILDASGRSGHAPLPVVTRDGRQALIAARTDQQTQLLQLDLQTGDVKEIHSFSGGVSVETGRDGRPVALTKTDPFAIYSRDGRHIVVAQHTYSYDSSTQTTIVRTSAELLTLATGNIAPLPLDLPDGYVIGTAG